MIPEVTLEAVAGGATIDEVFEGIRAALTARLVMVCFQLAPALVFAHATVATAVVERPPQMLTAFLLCHTAPPLIGLLCPDKQGCFCLEPFVFFKPFGDLRLHVCE